MIVFSNTSPLNYLVRLGQQETLKDLFGTVFVPRAVLDELTHPEAPAAVRRWANAAPDWLRVVGADTIDATLPSDLGAGERAAISMASAQKADLLLMDDRSGREEAELRGLVVEGTLAVLLKAALREQVDLRASLARLRQLKFRASPAVVEGVSRDTSVS